MNRLFFHVLGFILVFSAWPLQNIMILMAGVGSIFVGMGRD